MKHVIILCFILMTFLTNCKSQSKENFEKARSFNDSAGNIFQNAYFKNDNIDTNIFKTVLSLYDKAIQTDSSYILAYRNKYNLLSEFNKYREMIDLYLLVSNKIKIRKNRNVTLGILYEKIGMKDSAIFYYNQALDHIISNNLTDCEAIFDKITALKLLNQPCDVNNLLSEECKKALEYMDINSSREEILNEFNSSQE